MRWLIKKTGGLQGAQKNSSRLVCLRQVRVNQAGTVSAINVRGELGRRIRDMGLVPGVKITVVGRAPLKDPVALRVRECILTLRNNEADFITVKTEETCTP